MSSEHLGLISKAHSTSSWEVLDSENVAPSPTWLVVNGEGDAAAATPMEGGSHMSLQEADSHDAAAVEPLEAAELASEIKTPTSVMTEVLQQQPTSPPTNTHHMPFFIGGGLPVVSSVDSLMAAGTFAHYSPTREGPLHSFRPYLPTPPEEVIEELAPSSPPQLEQLSETEKSPMAHCDVVPQPRRRLDCLWNSVWNWETDASGTITRCSAAVLALTVAQVSNGWVPPTTLSWFSFMLLCAAVSMKPQWAEGVPQLLAELYQCCPILYCSPQKQVEQDGAILLQSEKAEKHFVFTSPVWTSSQKVLLAVEVALATAALIPMGLYLAVQQSDAAAVALAASAVWYGPARLMWKQ